MAAPGITPSSSEAIASPAIPWWVFAAVVLLAAVLHFGGLGTAGLTPDESYTAVASARPVGDLLAFIRETDPHPPLSYLLEKPALAVADSNAALRFLPALFSTLAVAAMAVWQRREGVAGLTATVLLAVAPEQLLYGRQARMYGLLVLAGVVVAWASCRWLAGASRRWGAVAAAAATVAALSHSTGFVLLAGLLLVPWLRRDREAWALRAMAGAGVVVTAVVFAPVALDRAGDRTFYPRTSLGWVTTTVNEQLAPVPAQKWLVIALLVVGGTLLIRRGGPQARVWLALFAAPLLGLVLVSFRVPLLLPKSVLSLSWGVVLALGALVGAAWKRLPVAGIAVAALLALLTVPYVAEARAKDEGAGRMAATVSAQAVDGDVVAVRPENLGTLVEWQLGRIEGRVLHPVTTPWDVTVAWRVGAGPPTGRTWLVESPDRVLSDVDADLDAGTSCGPERVPVGGEFLLSCLDDVPVEDAGG